MSNLLKYFIALFLTCVGISLLWFYYTPPETQLDETIPKEVSGSETQSETIPEKVSGSETQPETIPEKVSGSETQPETIPEKVSGSETQPEIIPKRVPEGVPERASNPKAQPETIPEKVPEKFPEKFVFEKPLEKVDLEYKRNIHFSVKTSSKNYRARLSLLLLTWFQAVDKDQV